MTRHREPSQRRSHNSRLATCAHRFPTNRPVRNLTPNADTSAKPQPTSQTPRRHAPTLRSRGPTGKFPSPDQMSPYSHSPPECTPANSSSVSAICRPSCAPACPLERGLLASALIPRGSTPSESTRAPHLPPPPQLAAHQTSRPPPHSTHFAPVTHVAPRPEP